MKRVVTYDVKEGNDYDRFYKFVEETSAEQITKSTYLFDTNLSQKTLKKDYDMFLTREIVSHTFLAITKRGYFT